MSKVRHKVVVVGGGWFGSRRGAASAGTIWPRPPTLGYVPATSNQAERDLRPSKTQQKISGRLTSEQRTKDRYRTRGYLCTAAKHGHNMMDALRGAILAAKGKVRRCLTCTRPSAPRPIGPLDTRPQP